MNLLIIETSDKLTLKVWYIQQKRGKNYSLPLPDIFNLND